MMKKTLSLILGSLLLATGLTSRAVDWKSLANQNLANGSLEASDMTPETGVYWLILKEVPEMPGKSDEERLGVALLEAKRRLAALILGENASGARSLEVRNDDTKLEEHFTAKVNARIRAAQMVGQVCQGEDTYLILVSFEKADEQADALRRAMEQMGDQNVVRASGIAVARDTALQKALRNAVEQVLGTLVVGYAKHTNQQFENRLFSGANGVVEEYRLLGEDNENGLVRVDIVAKVARKKLLDNYRNYMRFLGNPYFYVHSNSEQLEVRFNQFFLDLGIRTTPDPNNAAFIIQCDGQFVPITHPVNQRKGIQLSLSFRIHAADGSDALLSMTNDPRKSACFVGQNPQRQMEICAQKAFEQMKQPLHLKIQEMVSRMLSDKFEEMQDKD